MYPRILDSSAAESTASAWALVSALDGRPVPFPTGQSQSRTTFRFTRSRACARVIARRIAGEDLVVLVDDADAAE